MYKATKVKRRRASKMLTGEQVLELRDQLRAELAWLREGREKRVCNDGHRVDYAHRCARVLTALERIEEGTYGRCSVCGEPIPFERLECVPDTTRCVTCRANGFTPSKHG